MFEVPDSELIIQLTDILEKIAGILLLINKDTKPIIADSMTPTVVSSTKNPGWDTSRLQLFRVFDCVS